jgi:hypothetical protein
MNEKIKQLRAFVPVLKQVNSIISQRDLVHWFNVNDIEYLGMTDMEMYIYFCEHAINL